jgi:hypothetical protein
MSTTTETRDAISTLCSVSEEAVWASAGRTLQQALMLCLFLPDGHVDDLNGLARAIGVPIKELADMPIPATSFRSGGHWVIAVSDALTLAQQLHHALHQLKHIVDTQQQARTGLNVADREAQAELFAQLVLGRTLGETSGGTP